MTKEAGRVKKQRMPASSFSVLLPRTDYARFNASVGGALADAVKAAEFPETKLRFWNDRWARRVGIGDLGDAEKIAAFARFNNAAGGGLRDIQPSALAMRYHGHQFRHYNRDLGDGRGFLYAQCEDPIDHRLLDFGTKGSGQTPWSRAGDGRLTLKGAVREALATEMLESLGVTTSKTFCFFETGEKLERGDEPSPTRSAVLTRLSHGHIRYGTFQRLAVLGEVELMHKLVDYCLETYFADLQDVAREEKPFRMLERIVSNAADLAASWMISGFVHGVLNTDNMNITGESFDYGPWRFLPFYDPAFTAAYFDHEGLYSYSRQPEAVYWNLDQLARSLFSMAPEGDEQAWTDRFVQILEKYPALFQSRLLSRFYVRLGMKAPIDHQGGEKLGSDIFVALFGAMGESKVPFEDFFYDWYGGRLRSGHREKVQGRYQTPQTHAFAKLLEDALSEEKLQPLPETAVVLQSEYYQRGRSESMLIEEVEAIWSAIDQHDDWSNFHSKILAMRERGRVHGYGI